MTHNTSELSGTIVHIQQSSYEFDVADFIIALVVVFVVLFLATVIGAPPEEMNWDDVFAKAVIVFILTAFAGTGTFIVGYFVNPKDDPDTRALDTISTTVEANLLEDYGVVVVNDKATEVGVGATPVGAMLRRSVF